MREKLAARLNKGRIAALCALCYNIGAAPCLHRIAIRQRACMALGVRPTRD
jgi:GH24 family phage-related lysozyme (muramidase)